MSEQAIKFRPCKFPKDLSGIMKLEKQSFGAEAFPATEFLMLYAMGRETFWIVERQGEIIAYICAFVEDHYGYIASIAVDPKERRKGIGKDMIEHLINLLKSKPGIKGIVLHVRQSNQSAIALYRKLKFIPEALIPDYYPDKGVAIQMKLEFDRA